MSGVQAKPTRGLNRCESFFQMLPSPGEAKVNPPGTTKFAAVGTATPLIVAGILASDFEAYAAMAAVAVGLGSVKSKPLTVRPSFSEYGVSWSKRIPRLMVR